MKFFALFYIFESLPFRLLCMISVTSIWLRNSWQHSAAAADDKVKVTDLEISVMFMSKFSVKFFFCLYFWQFQLIIADVKLALQKDGFILLLSIHPSVGMSAHTNVNILRQSFAWIFFSFAYIFESFLSKLLMFD